jgi:hypothetical protein
MKQGFKAAETDKKMAFLDWMKEKLATRQQPVAKTAQQQKPETAKEMYTREAAMEQQSRKPLARMRESDKTETKRLASLLEKATQHLRNDSPAPSAMAGEGAANPEPMRQNMLAQDNAAPALSPTSGQKGTPDPGKGAPFTEMPPTGQPKSSPKPPQPTVQRRPPSWER